MKSKKIKLKAKKPLTLKDEIALLRIRLEVLEGYFRSANTYEEIQKLIDKIRAYNCDVMPRPPKVWY